MAQGANSDVTLSVSFLCLPFTYKYLGILNPKGCSSKHGAEEEPGLHQVLQPHGVHRGHGPGASRHPGVNLI
jgi:hypothetical protein